MKTQDIISKIISFLVEEECRKSLVECEEKQFYEAIEGLYNLYNKEKEKNEKIQLKIEAKEKEHENDMSLIDKIKGDYLNIIKERYVSKDKIREKIKELEKDEYYNCDELQLLRELLKE